MKLRQADSLLRLIVLLAAIAASGNGAWAASNNCSYNTPDTAAGGTGIGGTGNLAKGTGMGGTGITLGVFMSDTQFVGNVTLGQGTVEAQSNGRSRFLSKGDPVCVGDTLVTSQTGSVQIRTADGGSITIRPQTTLKIEKFVNSGSSKDGSQISLLKGTCHIVPGKTGRRYPPNSLIKTPSATISASGADHEIAVILPGEGSYPAGTYDKVNSGTTRIRTEAGELDIQANQAGYAADAEKMPTLLNDIPDFYKSYPPMKQGDGSSE